VGVAKRFLESRWKFTGPINKYQIHFQSCGHGRLGHFVGVRVGVKKFFGKSIEIYKTNRIWTNMKTFLKRFSFYSY